MENKSNDLEADIADISAKISDLELKLNKLKYRKKYLFAIKNNFTLFSLCENEPYHRSAKIYYSRKELVDTIVNTNIGIIEDLSNIISDYAYQLKYVNYYNYRSLNSCYSANEINFRDHNSFVFKNFFIEYVNGICYVVDIITNELINQITIRAEIDGWIMYSPSKCFVRDHNKVYLVGVINNISCFSITFHDNNCEFKKEDNLQILRDSNYNVIFDPLGLPTVESKMSINKKIDEIIDIEELELELRKLLDDTYADTDIQFDKCNFRLDSQNYLSIVFYVNGNYCKTAYILEYDMNKKKILYHYLLGYSSDIKPQNIHAQSHQLAFDGEYLCTLDQGMHYAIIHKKIVV
jgi:hypothetical protein